MTSLRNRRLAAARAWLHDTVCKSTGCHGDGDHARRTQHTTARAAVDTWAQEGAGRALRTVLHDSMCLGGGTCAIRDTHIDSDGAHRAVRLLVEAIETAEGVSA